MTRDIPIIQLWQSQQYHRSSISFDTHSKRIQAPFKKWGIIQKLHPHDFHFLARFFLHRSTIVVADASRRLPCTASVGASPDTADTVSVARSPMDATHPAANLGSMKSRFLGCPNRNAMLLEVDFMENPRKIPGILPIPMWPQGVAIVHPMWPMARDVQTHLERGSIPARAVIKLVPLGHWHYIGFILF